MTIIVFLPTMYVDVTDYSPVNRELTFRGEPAQDTLAEFAVTIERDEVVEALEEFYLNVVPIENAIILTPRITVRILDGELCVLLFIIHYTLKQSYRLIVSKPAYLRDTYARSRDFPTIHACYKIVMEENVPIMGKAWDRGYLSSKL